MITLTPGEVTLAQLEQIWRGNDAIALHSDTKAPIEAAAAFVSKQRLVALRFMVLIPVLVSWPMYLLLKTRRQLCNVILYSHIAAALAKH